MLSADEHAQFPFHDAVVFVGVIHDALAQFGIFFKRLMAAVDHHAGEAFIDALLAQLEGVAMIEMDRDGDIGSADGRLNELLEINGAGVLAGAFGDLKHDRRLFLLAGLDDGLEQFHIVDVEGTDAITALGGFVEDLAQCGEWHRSLLADRDRIWCAAYPSGVRRIALRTSAAKATAAVDR